MVFTWALQSVVRRWRTTTVGHRTCDYVEWSAAFEYNRLTSCNVTSRDTVLILLTASHVIPPIYFCEKLAFLFSKRRFTELLNWASNAWHLSNLTNVGITVSKLRSSCVYIRHLTARKYIWWRHIQLVEKDNTEDIWQTSVISVRQSDCTVTNFANSP